MLVTQRSVLLILCGVALRAQSPVLDSYLKGQESSARMYEAAARIAIERQRLELQQHEAAAQIAAEAEKVKLERQRVELQQRQVPTVSDTDGSRFANLLKEIKSTYPDFDSYTPDIGTLSQIFAIGNSPAFTLERYLEGLYFIAKYSRLQQAAKLPPITNAEVVSLKESGLGDDVIISKLGASSSALTLDTDGIIRLKKDGMSDAVIAAMLEVDRKRQ